MNVDPMAECRRQANSQRERPVIVSPFPLWMPAEGGREIPANVYFDVPRSHAAQLVSDGFAEYVDDVPADWEDAPPGVSYRDTDEDGVDRSDRKPIDPLGLIFPALFVFTLVLAAAKGVGVLTCSWWLALAPIWLALAIFVACLAVIFVGVWREEGD